MVRFRDRFGDTLGNGYIMIIRAVPSLLYLFFIQVQISKWFNLPMVYYDNKPLSWILPIISLALSSIAWYALWLRRFMVDEENQDYVKFATVKGLSKSAVLKKHIFPLLTAVQPEESCYEQIRGLVKILNYIQEADVDDEIPPTSLVREFIGGNAFYR